jgi:hypothetical protein
MFRLNPSNHIVKLRSRYKISGETDEAKGNRPRLFDELLATGVEHNLAKIFFRSKPHQRRRPAWILTPAGRVKQPDKIMLVT